MNTVNPPAPVQHPSVPSRAGAMERIRAAGLTTPGRYRLASLAAAALLALAFVTTVGAAVQMRSATERAETRTGPVLVATQQLVSSLAEADAAASAAFLSGREEDPEQRRLYEEALARAGRQVEEIASLSGQDADIRALVGRISVQVTRYAGLVEAARASSRAGSTDANGYLVSAVRLADGLVHGDVRGLAEEAQGKLRSDEDQRSRGFPIAVIALALALAVLGWGLALLARTSRRLVNLPLAVATILTLVALGWLVRANQASGSALGDARTDGYDAIVVTSDLAESGFGARASETLAVITGEAAQRGEADADARRVSATAVTPAVAEGIRRGEARGAPGGLLGQAAEEADSPRERAAVAEAAVRWQRYQDTVAALRGAPNAAAARTIAVGPASSDFNGFNFSVEAILGQNRGQFLAGLDEAADRTARAPGATLLLLLAALAAMFWGFQLRINDYR